MPWPNVQALTTPLAHLLLAALLAAAAVAWGAPGKSGHATTFHRSSSIGAEDGVYHSRHGSALIVDAELPHTLRGSTSSR